MFRMFATADFSMWENTIGEQARPGRTAWDGPEHGRGYSRLCASFGRQIRRFSWGLHSPAPLHRGA